MSEYYDEVPLDLTKDKYCPPDGEFLGDGWSVRQSQGKFFFEYISGELEGRVKVIEISESDFLQAKSGNLTVDDICIKYGVS